jgi:hypothetical protein
MRKLAPNESLALGAILVVVAVLAKAYATPRVDDDPRALVPAAGAIA